MTESFNTLDTPFDTLAVIFFTIPEWLLLFFLLGFFIYMAISALTGLWCKSRARKRNAKQRQENNAVLERYG